MVWRLFEILFLGGTLLCVVAVAGYVVLYLLRAWFGFEPIELPPELLIR